MLVVLGHALAFRYQTGWLLQLTHLTTPLFIFLAGVFMAPYKPWGQSLWRKTDGLLKPYVFVLLGWGVVHAFSGKLAWNSYLAGVVYGTGATIVLVPLWFLPHLFLCLLTGAVVIRGCDRMALPPVACGVLAAVLLLIAGVYGIEWMWRQPLPAGIWKRLLGPATHWPGLPFSADVLPVTLPILLAGYWLSSQIKQFRLQPRVSVFAFAVIGLLLTGQHVAFDINRRIFEGGMLAGLFIAAGIYVVLSLSVWLSRYTKVSSAVAYVGRHFLLILLLHLLVLRGLFRQLQQGLPDLVDWHVPLAFIAGMLLSVLLVEIVRRSRWLSLLLLPVAGKPAGERKQ